LISDSTLQALHGDYVVVNSQKINVKGINATILVHQIRENSA